METQEEHLETEVEDIEMPPEAPEDDLPNAAPPPPARQTTTPTTRRRKGKRAPVSAAAKAKQSASAAMEYEEWYQQWDWELPGMRTTLTRRTPDKWHGTKISGRVANRVGAPFTPDDVHETYGGGLYDVHVYGPRGQVAGADITSYGHKHLDLPGDPNTENTLPTQQQKGPVPAAAPPGDLAATAQGKLLENNMALQDRMFGVLADRTAGAEGIDPVALQAIEKSAAAQVAAIKEAATAEAAMLRAQLDQVHRDMAQVREQAQREAQDVKNSADASRQEAQGWMTTLLPTMAQNASTQTELAHKLADDRVRAAQDHYEKLGHALEERYKTQAENIRALYETQTKNIEMLFTGQVQHLHAQLDLANKKAEMLEAERKIMSDRIMQLHAEQSKKADPASELERMAQLKDLAQSLVGGEDTGNPILDVAAKALGPISDAVAVWKANQLGRAPAPEQMAMLQHAQATQAKQGQTRAVALRAQLAPQGQQRPVPPQRAMVAAKKPPSVKAPVAMLEQGVMLLNSAIRVGQPHEQAANAIAAANAIDRRVLRKLVKLGPEGTLRVLHKAGLLRGELETPPGQEYLVGFLTALQNVLYPVSQEAAPSDPAPRLPNQDADAGEDQ